MDYAGDKGGNIVFTDSLIPEVKDVPLTLTASYLWDALGLPLTAFNDSRRKGSIRTITDHDFQPYQYALVQLRDDKGKPVVANGKTIDFFGTDPVDISNCSLCHSANGLAANLSRQSGLTLFDKEYAYWKKNYPDVSEFMARLSSATIDILELHDKHHKTEFLQDYNPDAASNRLGERRVGELRRLPRRQYVGKPPVPEAGRDRLHSSQGKTAHRGGARRPCAVRPHAGQGGEDPELPGLPSVALAGYEQ